MLLALLLLLSLSLALFSGCAMNAGAYCDLHDMGLITIEDEMVALASAPAAMSTMLLPEPSGKSVQEKNGAVIDYSNIGDGYVMVRFTEAVDKKLKVQVAGPTTKYSYNLNPQEWATFPLSDGNGSYTVGVYKNASGNKYSSVVSVTFEAELKDEFAPFLRPNQYVNYEKAEKTVAKAAALTKDREATLDKVEVIYNFVLETMDYSDELAATVESGYLPDLDRDLESGSGICFDYAALMTGMLRSVGVPTKLVVGYAQDLYHAWISVFSEQDGWVDGAVYFDGKTWSRMDPTFVDTGGKQAYGFIADDRNYEGIYFY